MFDLVFAPFTRLDPPAPAERSTRPEHAEGLTLLAGERPRPYPASTLFLLSLVEPGRDALAGAAAQAREVLAQIGAAAAAVIFDSAEQDALLEARQRHAAGRAELAQAGEVLREAEEHLQAAVREVRNPAGLRKPVDDARQAVSDATAWVNQLAQLERAAGAKVAQKREAVRRGLVATRLRELSARRDELREAAAAAIRSLGSELLAIDALERALKG